MSQRSTLRDVTAEQKRFGKLPVAANLKRPEVFNPIAEWHLGPRIDP